MGLNDLLLSTIAQRDASARRHVIDRMTSAGATSPANAQPLRSIGLERDTALERLLREGRVREGAPDHFYLFATPSAGRRERLVKMIVFYTLIVLIPIVLMRLSRR